MKNSIFILLLFPFYLSASNIDYTPDLQEDPYKPFAQVMPEVIGGIESVQKKIKYPDLAIKTGIEGKVYVLVYVNETGGVDDVKLVKGIGAGCDDAAINALKNSSFSPGKENGSPIKVKLTLPVTFKLKK